MPKKPTPILLGFGAAMAGLAGIGSNTQDDTEAKKVMDLQEQDIFTEDKNGKN